MPKIERLSHHNHLSVVVPQALFERHNGQLTQVNVMFVEEGLVSQKLAEISCDAGFDRWRGGGGDWFRS